MAIIRRSLGGADAVFSDRRGGVSVAPFDDLNLALQVGDTPLAVMANRKVVAQWFGSSDLPWVAPHHVHGTTVLVASDALLDGETGDGVATDRAGLLLAAMGADCAPIVLANDTACAAIHAGWRGASDGVVAAGVERVRALGVGPIRCVVGPCVCSLHYEFGEHLLGELADRLGPTVVGRTADGAPSFDLRAAIRRDLERSGVDDIEVIDVCTVESMDHYSYRREGQTGRHGVVVMKR